MKILNDGNLFFLKVYFATLAAIGFVLMVIYFFFAADYAAIKEACLQRGGTAVEYPEGKFERCIER